MSINTNLYICNGQGGFSVGSPFKTKQYAYNGGGYGQKMGGGCTHIAINTNRGVLKNYVNNKNEVLIVAGGGGWYGGGGSTTSANGGGGGSGHIGAVTNGTMKTGVWSGSGQTLITWMPVL